MSTIEKAIEKLARARGKTGDSDKAATEIENAPVPDAAASDQQDVSIGGAAAPTESVSDVKSPPQDDVVRWDLQRLQTAGLVVKDGDKNPLAEEYRLIKRPLLINAFGQGATAVPNGNLIMITSALPGEGKTFTAINLAMSIALERDRTVLLVDADVAKPGISDYIGRREWPGLVDYLLSDNMPLSDVLLQTDVPKLRLLPAGRRHPHSTELLASESMRRLAQELATRYPDRVVIFDSPPLLATSEAGVLAALMGQIVMVVEAGRTTQDVIQDALGHLNPEIMTSLVLNKSYHPFGSPYYDYYAEYGK
jgi:protein-tyrosine kinase